MRNITSRETKKLAFAIWVLAIVTLVATWLGWCVTDALGWLFIAVALLLLIAFAFATAIGVYTDDPAIKKQGKWYLGFTIVFFILLLVMLAIGLSNDANEKWAYFAPALMTVFLVLVIAIGTYFMLVKKGIVKGNNTSNPL